MNKRKRYLTNTIEDLALSRYKMALISGPRQCGKTTLAKILLNHHQSGAYYNWDDIEFRRQWNKSPRNLTPESKRKKPPLYIFDEIHKAPKWKQQLKGIYDINGEKVNIIVTGSARLNLYKKGGDSLLGRYLNFRLHPFSFGELSPYPNWSPDQWLQALFESPLTQSKYTDLLNDLMTYGGFPEPFLSQDLRYAKLWQRNRIEKLIREDLRDLSRLMELGQIEIVASLLPQKVSAPLSIQSLREDLEVSYDTMKRWLNYLKELYYFFDIKPWHKSISRSLKKETKIYMWDWTEVQEKGARFENFIASHLLKACHFWTDTGEGVFELYTIKNREKQEIDFLITKDNQPWLPIECKLKEEGLSRHLYTLLPKLNCPHFIQVISTPNTYKPIQINTIKGAIISADLFLARLI